MNEINEMDGRLTDLYDGTSTYLALLCCIESLLLFHKHVYIKRVIELLEKKNRKLFLSFILFSVSIEIYANY